MRRALALAVRGAQAAIRNGTASGRTVYFSPEQFPWAREIESGWRSIRAELDQVLEERARVPAFHEVSPEQASISKGQEWKAFVFYVFGEPVRKNCRRCPETHAHLKRIPGLCNAMFSILAPGATIPEHNGPYNGLIRYHLALKVPSEGTCAIWVDGIRAEWREGATMMFDDSHIHSVRNDTPEERVVLFADFERPLPWPLALINRTVIAIISAQLGREARKRLEKGQI